MRIDDSANNPLLPMFGRARQSGNVAKVLFQTAGYTALRTRICESPIFSIAINFDPR